MAQKLSKNDAKLRRQKNLINHYKKQTHWMKAAIIAAAIIILLLLFFCGYATDWGQGLKKNKDLTATPVASQLEGGGTSIDQVGGGGGTVSTRSNTSDQARTNTGSNTVSDTTRNTTTNTTTTPSPAQPPTNLLSLYADGSVGSNISDLLSQAGNLGVSVSCNDNLLLQVCIFSQDGAQITTKNLLGTGIITSITSNL